LPELPWLLPGCFHCGKELAAASQPLCGACLISPPLFSRGIFLWSYQPPISSLIIKLKFNHKLNLAKPLGGLLAKQVANVYHTAQQTLPDCLIPVPLHRSRLRKRGYNQAVEIARPIKDYLQIPMDIKNVHRKIPTLPQTLLPAKERSRNVKKVFTTNQAFLNQHVAIVDDVVTTFSTVTALCEILIAQGARRVDVWCLARA
jgi:ComF family protein